jgi:phosphoglycolate phosphatase-like HAD superfamily hydrolase|tara:strand:+ start:255 stop:881 length:627 start_codon:yes stop_codon:yes gene_type:complete
LLKGIIFDFDGVIAESVQVKTDAFATLYAAYGTDIVRKIVKHHEANGGMSRYEKFKIYHELFLNKTITEEENSALANHFSDLTVGKVIAAPYVRGALEFIKKSYDKYKLFISTGMPTEEMEKILAGRKIANYFTDVFGSPTKKTVHVSNILNNYNLDPNELIFYGDSKTDLDAAKHANISFVLIKNRYNQTLSASFRGKIINNFIGIL